MRISKSKNFSARFARNLLSQILDPPLITCVIPVPFALSETYVNKVEFVDALLP